MEGEGLHILLFITVAPISGYWVEHPIIWYIQICILYYSLEYNGSNNAISFLKSLFKKIRTEIAPTTSKKTQKYYLSYATNLEF